MNTSLKKVLWIMLGCMVVFAAISTWMSSRRVEDARQALADVRRELREQGFKTDLAEFNVSSAAATRARMAAVTALQQRPGFGSKRAALELLPCVSDDSATIVWQQTSMDAGGDTIPWSALHDLLDTNREALDEACAAIGSGPLCFDVDFTDHSRRWWAHWIPLLNLSLGLTARTVLELHDGNPDAAWTNLLAATRMVTAWPGPQGISHIIERRFVDDAFAVTWQALQSGGWPDEKLAVLQHEWESLDVLTNLPARRAFDRVNGLNTCEALFQRRPFEDFSFSHFANDAIHNPRSLGYEIKANLALLRYRGQTALTDQKNLLLYFRDRELELRRASHLPTWAAMRVQPGVTNVVPFKSALESLKSYWSICQIDENSLPARVAEVEAMRRIAIVAIALERYRGRYGAFPMTLGSLAPEFLETVPMDFMDGQTLRYRLTGNGHFVLYSVGLDCVDDGGKMPSLKGGWVRPDSRGFFLTPTNVDIVWPRPEEGGPGKGAGP